MSRPRMALSFAVSLGLAGALVLAGCGAAAGTANKKGAAAGVKGAFPIQYDTAGFLAPGQSGPTPGFGPNHDLDNATAPKPGPYTVTAGSTKVTFNFPQTVNATTPPNDILEVAYGSKATVKAAPGKYKRIYFLAGVASGPEPATVTLTYTDGSTQKEPVAFDDWCTVEIAHQPVSGTYPAWQGLRRIGETDGSTQKVSGGGYTGTNQGCGLYVSHVAANPAKTLKSLTISNTLSTVPSSMSGSGQGQISGISNGSRIGIVAITGV